MKARTGEQNKEMEKFSVSYKMTTRTCFM